MIFLAFEAFCDLLQPTILSRIIDRGVAGQQMDYVLKMGGMMLLITAAGAVAASMRNIISSSVSQRFGAELRGDLFRKTQALSFENMNRFNRASLVTRLTNDVTQVQMFVNGLMRIFVKAPLICIGSLIMAVHLDPHLAIVLAVVVPFIAVLIALNMRVSFPFFIKVQKALDKVNSMMREYLSGVRVVKAFNRFDVETEKFNRTNQHFQERSTIAMRVMSVFIPGIMLPVNFGIIAVLLIGGLRVQHGQMQVGHIIAFINYMTQILFSLMMISMIFNMYLRSRASAGRISEVFAEENSMTGSDPRIAETSNKGRIDFENVSFSYEGSEGESVIKGISFTCLPGETVGLIGSTGSGKSTLVSLIPRFYDATEGTVKVNGEDVKGIEPRKLREIIAVVPQKAMLFTGTVIENIRWGKEEATAEQVEKAAKMAEAHPFITASPEGYQTRIGQGGVNFSGGQKQRLSIARAFVREPEILILDDCTSAVDAGTETKIKASLKTYAAGMTCLIIAQRITTVMDADKIIVLDNGELADIGRHSELLARCSVYQEIYQSQAGKEVKQNASAN